jgi:ABC-type branched-subunit amino acid transport system substrate-binding protein
MNPRRLAQQPGAPSRGTTSRAARAATALAVAIGTCLAFGVHADLEHNATAGSASAQVDAGKELYRRGVDAAGGEIRAMVADAPVPGAQLSCAYCHRYSGLGTSEGSSVAPALTAAALYQRRETVLRKAYRSKAGKQERRAYTDETLAAAIRAGVDPSGRVLGRLMPRYELDDKSMASLIAYLKTLSAVDAPGVGDATLHLATIVTQGVSENDRRAMLDILETFVELKNRETRNEVRNSQAAPFYRELPYQAYRKWKLHVWELTGDDESWGAQLRDLYASQPVFAVINGIAAGSWAPIHDFCEQAEVPCLFPHTDYPVTARQGFYPLYLSQGLDLEARALARHIERSDQPEGLRIVQVWERGGPGETPARVFRETIATRSGIPIEDRAVAPGEVLDQEQLRSALAGEGPVHLVLWLAEPRLETFAPTASASPRLDRLFLSSSLSGHAMEVPTSLAPRVNLVHPFDVPENEPKRLFRLNTWLDSRGLERGDSRIQADAYFAVMFLGRAMKHLKQNFSREFLIEVLEHALDNATFTSVYPRVSLGPGQRFASKGSYILGLSDDENPEWQPVSDWIIP